MTYAIYAKTKEDHQNGNYIRVEESEAFHYLFGSQRDVITHNDKKRYETFLVRTGYSRYNFGSNPESLTPYDNRYVETTYEFKNSPGKRTSTLRYTVYRKMLSDSNCVVHYTRLLSTKEQDEHLKEAALFVNSIDR